jgi:hypothetical protein
MFARMSRYGLAPSGTATPGLVYSPARHHMGRHDAPLAQLAEQQTLHPLVLRPRRQAKGHEGGDGEGLPVIEPGIAERPQDWLTPDS